MHEPKAKEKIEPIEEQSLEDQVKLLLVDQPLETKKETQTTLQALLTQAIPSGDSGLLEKAFAVTDKKIIHATLRRLPPTLVLTLLDQLVSRIQKRPNRAGLLIEWIRASLIHHSSYLLSVTSTLTPQIPHLTQRLGSLHRTLTSRQDPLQKLMRLSGRLDMLANQTKVFPVEEDGNAVIFDANNYEFLMDGDDDVEDGDALNDEDVQDDDYDEIML